MTTHLYNTHENRPTDCRAKRVTRRLLGVGRIFTIGGGSFVLEGVKVAERHRGLRHEAFTCLRTAVITDRQSRAISSPRRGRSDLRNLFRTRLTSGHFEILGRALAETGFIQKALIGKFADAGRILRPLCQRPFTTTPPADGGGADGANAAGTRATPSIFSLLRGQNPKQNNQPMKGKS